MRTKTRGGALALLALAATTSSAAEIESRIARGGRLYDNWWQEKEISKPENFNPAFPNPDIKVYTESWRCPACHGWDYKGKDGDFRRGENFTGIKGISGAIGRDPAAIAALLRNDDHGYSIEQLDDKDAADLALFVSRGQVELGAYFDASGKPQGVEARGEVYYNTICAGCHKADGRGEIHPLGDSAANRARVLHKVFNGQPGEPMPALRALDPQIAVDIASYLNLLPKGKRRGAEPGP